MGTPLPFSDFFLSFLFPVVERNVCPDLQIHFVPGAPNEDSAKQAGLEGPLWDDATKHFSQEAILFLPTLLRPKR